MSYYGLKRQLSAFSVNLRSGAPFVQRKSAERGREEKRVKKKTKNKEYNYVTNCALSPESIILYFALIGRKTKEAVKLPVWRLSR